jgi:predicted O-methyltransferase YrrM
VTPNAGKLLHLLARLRGARRILEIGTLAGYSAVWLGRALPDGGRLITLERDPSHAALARSVIERAGLADRVTVREGAALDSLQAMVDEGVEPFDLVFIDADRASVAEYFRRSLSLTRVGSAIVVDNVVRGGAVIGRGSAEPGIEAVGELYELMASEPRVSATAMQTVGSKGHDGFALAVVVA